MQVLDLGGDRPLTLRDIELLCTLLRQHGAVEVRYKHSMEGAFVGPFLADIFPLIIERENK